MSPLRRRDEGWTLSVSLGHAHVLANAVPLTLRRARIHDSTAREGRIPGIRPVT